MNHIRLLNVALACRESPAPARFHMNHYVDYCGTPGCALGHYAVRDDLQDILTVVRMSLCIGGMLSWCVIDTEKAALFDDELLMDHFEIDVPTIWELFGPDGCGNAKTHMDAAIFIERCVINDFSAKHPELQDRLDIMFDDQVVEFIRNYKGGANEPHHSNAE